MDATLLDYVKNFKLTSHKRRCSDKDFVDRLNDFYTPLVLTLFSITICAKAFLVGQPMQCWVPAYFSEGWENFAESFCFIKNTYYIPEAREIPPRGPQRSTAELAYYQWIPFVLALQAAMFMVPSFLWKIYNWRAKLHIKPLIERAVMISFKSGTERQAALKSIAEHLHIGLFRKEHLPLRSKLRGVVNQRNVGGRFNIMGSNCYLSVGYLAVKVVFLVNLAVQLLIISSFLHTDLSYGMRMAHNFANGSDWAEIGLFPRVTLCDINRIKFGDNHDITLQCVLVIQLFNEKIYLFLWFWFIFLFLLTALSLFVWSFRIAFRSKITYSFSATEIEHDSEMSDQLDQCEQDATVDVCFLLRMIETNCGLLTARAVVRQLVACYKQPDQPKQPTLVIDHPTYRLQPPDYKEIVNPTDSQSQDIPLKEMV